MDRIKELKPDKIDQVKHKVNRQFQKFLEMAQMMPELNNKNLIFFLNEDQNPVFDGKEGYGKLLPMSHVSFNNFKKLGNLEKSE